MRPQGRELSYYKYLNNHFHSAFHSVRKDTVHFKIQSRLKCKTHVKQLTK
jgi:hypothetical protein